MNICGCVVQALPDRKDEVATAMADTPGVEVHGQSDDGRMVVVVEDLPDRYASEIIMDLHQVPGVISLTLTYHHFDDPKAAPAPGSAILPEAGEQPHDRL